MCQLICIHKLELSSSTSTYQGIDDAPHLEPAHCLADRSYYRADSVLIRLSADKAANSETYWFNSASTDVCHQGDMTFS
jgi:hypothetical protein